MNRRHLTIMTIDDHRAAAREWAAVHRGVAEFESIICKNLEDGRPTSRAVRGVLGQMRTNAKRIQKALDRIQAEMREVQVRTLPGDTQADLCWQEIRTVASAAAIQRNAGVPTLDDHITAARVLGAAKLAILRFLKIIGDRRHLPVRILDLGLRVEHLMHAVRCAMDDVQYATLRGPDRLVNCWLGHFNYFDGDEDGDTELTGRRDENGLR